MSSPMFRAFTLSTCLTVAGCASTTETYPSQQMLPPPPAKSAYDRMADRFRTMKARGFCVVDPTTRDVTMFAYRGMDAGTNRPILTPEFRATNSVSTSNFGFFGKNIQKLPTGTPLPDTSVATQTVDGCSLSTTNSSNTRQASRYFYLGDDAKKVLLAPDAPKLPAPDLSQ